MISYGFLWYQQDSNMSNLIISSAVPFFALAEPTKGCPCIQYRPSTWLLCIPILGNTRNHLSTVLSAAVEKKICTPRWLTLLISQPATPVRCIDHFFLRATAPWPASDNQPRRLYPQRQCDAVVIYVRNTSKYCWRWCETGTSTTTHGMPDFNPALTTTNSDNHCQLGTQDNEQDLVCSP